VPTRMSTFRKSSMVIVIGPPASTKGEGGASGCPSWP
jgi:hypothetical protein